MLRKSDRILDPLLLGKEYVLVLAVCAHVLELDQGASLGAIAHCFGGSNVYVAAWVRVVSCNNSCSLPMHRLRPHSALPPVEELILYVRSRFRQVVHQGIIIVNVDIQLLYVNVLRSVTKIDFDIYRHLGLCLSLLRFHHLYLSSLLPFLDYPLLFQSFDLLFSVLFGFFLIELLDSYCLRE